MSGILNSQELREFQDMTKHLGTIAKNMQRKADAISKQKTVEKDAVDAINNLSKVIESSTGKLTTTIDSLIAEIKKSRD